VIAAALERLASITDLDVLAHGVVAMPPVEGDRLIAAQVALAVRERRTGDAVRWQRVRLRARALRRRSADV
jgi:hypothetical protein